MSTSNPYAPPRGAIQDIAVGDGLELGGRAVRLAAALADAVIGFVMTYLPALIVLASMGAFGGVEQDDSAFLMAGLVFFCGLVAWALITAMLVARTGQTMGKRLLEIRVVRSDGSPASLGRIFWLRNFVNALLGVIPPYWIIDHLLIFGERRQCIHDLIADTIVVKV